MWKAYQRYRALDPEARSLFGQAVLLLPQISLSLRARGFTKTKDTLQQKLHSTVSDRPLDQNTAEQVQKTCRMVKAASRYGIVRPTCLVESLALWYLLQKQGISVALRIGVRKSEKFEAHAWVECAGVALTEPEAKHQEFAAFDAALASLPPETR